MSTASLAPDERAALIERWRSLRDAVEAAGARLIAVSKYAPDAKVTVLTEAGQRDFGESRPQSLRDRAGHWPQAAWHMIGPLQRNKAKYVGRFAAIWHSCEDSDTAQAVARHVTDRTLPVLVQVRLVDAPNRHGVPPDRAAGLVETVDALAGLRVIGLMGMAAAQGDPRPAFARLRRLRDEIFGDAGELCIGMSGDWRVALEEGATMVRIGSALFGPRPAAANRE
ncbi:MAG: YggS family pyridoxal phosphate enzyme [Mariprofundaceae bacterium]